ncbi:CAP domain-containing protein [Streptomyces albus subsp. chlorinus]|uniref:CAP domain-containing protein n=1 Tax=Streptomyces albus TaxID=1888 RepID=UPI00156ED7DB|nr:CAP domain-containing protein [Streptomyces albus]NSC24132.1 CAP domain-containing protein [Streptomyces albus subsp. chlorinus]
MGRHRRSTPASAPRAGILGASAALAVGAVALASGLVPGAGGSGDHQEGRVRAQDGPRTPAAPASGSPTDRPATPAAGGTGERHEGSASAPARKPSHPAGTPRDTPAPSRSAQDGGQESPRGSRSGGDREPEPAGSGGGTAAADQEAAAEREVLTLVNQERAKAGCRPVSADGELAALAGGFSEDMARRGFFSHTSPDGESPWDRAEAAGVEDLGGENIARGQANARSVMDSWMHSPGHRANILNCDYRTLGVGAHFAEGGPWWTQDFGF